MTCARRLLCRRSMLGFGFGLVLLLGPPAGGPAGLVLVAPAWSADRPPAGEEFRIEVTKKGLGKEVVISKGNKEWFMLIEVTAENTVVVRQVKDNEVYLVDESETHDRAMTAAEVDAAIEAFINGARTQTRQK